MLAALAALLFSAASAGAQGTQTWQKFEPAGEGFSVQLPAAPASETRVNPADARMKMRLHKSETDSHSYYIASMDYRGLFQQSAAGFDAFAKGFLESYCGPARKQGLICEATFERELKLGGFPGKQYRVIFGNQDQKLDGVLRMYMTATHLYAFHALGGKEGDASVDRFLNSFAINAAKPAGN